MRQRWEAEELVEFWTLEADELALVANKSGTTRLGFAVLLKFFSHEARFPRRDQIPVEVVDFVARQVGVAFSEFGSYDWSGRSWKRHRGQIRAHLGFRAWSEQIDAVALVEGLVGGAAGEGLGFDELVDAAYRWCRENRIEPPFEGPLHRLVRSADRTDTPITLDDIDRRGLNPLTYRHINPGCHPVITSSRIGPGCSVRSMLEADPTSTWLRARRRTCRLKHGSGRNTSG